MKLSFTARAAETVEAVQADRTDLVMVLSNGCCDSTAPYLYDRYLPEAGSEVIAEVAGVAVLAPAWIRKLYGGDAELTVDVIDDPNEDSLSLETDLGRRFVLRAPGNAGLG